MKHLDFYRKNVPGFEMAILYQTASQAGGRVSRRIIGEHVLTMDELESGVMSDTIGKVSGLKRGFISDIPYGSLVPKKIDNLFVADAVSQRRSMRSTSFAASPDAGFRTGGGNGGRFVACRFYFAKKAECDKPSVVTPSTGSRDLIRTSFDR